MSHIMHPYSTNDTVLFEAQIIHRLIDRLFNLFPVRPALDEFVDILARVSRKKRDRVGRGIRGMHRREKTYLGPIRASIPRNITHDLRQVFGVLDDEDVPEHLEVIKIRSNVGYLRGQRIVG